MSDAKTFEQLNKAIDEALVYGYVRDKFMSNDADIHIPKDIIELCLKFYHIIQREIFKNFNPMYFKLSNNDRTVTTSQNLIGGGICYGSLCISSMDAKIYEWTFKIIKRTANMAIGIDETKYIRKDKANFNMKLGESKSYALWHDGDKNEWKNKKLIKATKGSPKYNTNDIVRMKLDLMNRILFLIL